MNLLKSIFGLAVLIVFGFLCLCVVVGLVDYFNKPDETKTTKTNEEFMEDFIQKLPEQSSDTATYKVDTLKYDRK
ncbi:MAG: hypothetical protein HJHJAOHD_02569 [Flavobacteriales bacterium]|nr:hypothetical protein [Flavobacteriales bacterium]